MEDYRNRQILEWHRKGIYNAAEMTNLPKELREELGDMSPLREVRRLTSKDGTVKILWELLDGETVESVVMAYKHGRTICLSTQAGCTRNCAFCASGQDGFSRNLTAGEMLAQTTLLRMPVNNIVLMGIGEPLDNYDNVISFFDLAGAGARSISLSTCGIVPGIRKLAASGWPVTLSVSLHAPNNELRGKIMPVNRQYPLEELFSACQVYFDKTGRRVSYEYAIMKGFNDTRELAGELAAVLPKPAHVNLIPANRTAGHGLEPANPKNIQAFAAVLSSKGISCTVRRTLGDDIDAACGQLRRGGKV
jgi:23S rRNA (adenine2503-C2)-methyltransferase